MDNGTLIANLRAQLGGPRDGAMLRYSLGNALLSAGDAEQAVLQLREALTFDPEYSAAWKALGKAQLAVGDAAAAAQAWREGIGVADRRGDVQARRDVCGVFGRLEATGPGSG
jgi:Tfp pilus assembly protein PilF